jgi:hypothetical protein
MKYENRVTVFLDILGFKNLIKRTEDRKGNDNEEEIGYLNDTFLLIRELLGLDNLPENESKSKQITQFSDSIIISFIENEESQVFFTLNDLKNLVVNLILRGVICRGAISYGKLVHNDKMIFGPALVDAYETESKAALYPRIILDRKIINIGMKYHAIHHDEFTEKMAIKGMLVRDTDDMFYIDYFFNVTEYLENGKLDIPIYFNKLQQIIETGLVNRSPDIKIKYNWMKNKFNLRVPQFKENINYVFAGNNETLKNFFDNAKPIK